MTRTLARMLQRVVAAGALAFVLPAALADDWSDGRAVFKGNCWSCHGVNIPGATGAALGGKSATTLQTRINNPPSSSMKNDPRVKALNTCSGAYPCTGAPPSINDNVRKLSVYLANPSRGAGSVSVSGSTAFGSLAANRQSSSDVTVTLTAANDVDPDGYLPNYGDLAISAVALSDTSNFKETSNDCIKTLAPGGTCTYKFRFQPQAVGDFSDRTLTFTHDGVDGGTTLSGISGSGFEPSPVYTPGAGFDALASGFTTDTSGSITLCPVIGNTGLYDELTVSVLALASGSTDYTAYYEIDSSPSACSSPPARCLPSGATSVTGSFSVASASTCTLALKFNPGKYGFTGGTGARPATLSVTHNGPTSASPASYTLGGVVTSGPTPRIGVTTTPSADTSGKVLPNVFSSQVVGIASDSWKDFLVSNTGTADGLVIASVTHTHMDEFTLTQDCVAAGPLARVSNGGKSCGIQMVFTPAAAPTGLGQRCTTVTISAAFTGIPDESVQVCGTGVPVPVPASSVKPSSIDFGRRSIGAIYTPRPLVISNGSGATADLQIASVTIVGAGFAFVPDASACAGKALARNTSCTLQLQFTPGATPDTDYAADVTIDSNDPAMPKRSVHLTATAVAAALPVLQWQSGQTAVVFPDLVAAGQTSIQPQFARVINVGPGAVDVSAVRLVGPDASSFAASGCAALLYEGESCDIRISFLPGSGGAKQAQLQVSTRTGVAPATLPVSGSAVGGSSPYLLASMSSIAFGDVRVGAQSQPVSLRLTAGGDGVVTVTALSVSGPFKVAPVSCPALPFTLRLGNDCTVALSYVPTDSAPATGTLKVIADSPARPLEVALEGSAQPKADVSGGGCSTVDTRRALADPTLWLLVLAAAGMLWRRRGSGGTIKDDAR